MRPIDIVKKLCPNARPAYLAAFEAGDAQIQAAGITTPRRLAHFLAQCLHETDALTIAVENMNYSAPRIREVWPSRPEAVRFAHDPEGLANSVYGGRMGNVAAGDGWKYRGRGILQTTGRESYRKYGKRCGVDFEADPDLVLSADHALKPALAEWVDGKCNEMADRDDIVGITKRINGGTVGLSSRKTWLAKVRPVVGDKVDFKVEHVAAPAVAAGVAAAASAPQHLTPYILGFVALVLIGAAIAYARRASA